MTNILLESYQDIPSFRLISSILCSLKKYSDIGLRIKLTRYITKADINWCDVFISLRGYSKLSEYLARQAVEHGKYLILDIDDDLLNVSYPKISKIIDRKNKESLSKIINMANSLIVSNPYLGDKYSEKEQNYCVVNTIVDENEIVKREPWESDSIKIVYPAHVGHRVFYDQYILPNMGRLYERYGDRLSYHFIGPNIKVDDPRINVEYHDSMPYDVYTQYMIDNRFDIGVAPLFDTEVCRCKYFNKYIEYSKYGICGAYSNLMPYTMVVKNEVNGLLVENSVDSWYVALCRLIDSKDLRTSCLLNAQQQLRQEHNIDYVLTKLINDLPLMVTYISPELKVKSLKNMYLWFLYNALKRRLYSIRNILSKKG